MVTKTDPEGFYLINEFFDGLFYNDIWGSGEM